MTITLIRVTHPRRCSEEIPVQFTALPSPLRSPLGSIRKTHVHFLSLRTATRVLHESLLRNKEINQILGSQHCTSSPIVKLDIASEKSVMDILDDPGVELNSQFPKSQEPQQVASRPASNQDLQCNHQSPRENYHVVSHVENIIPEKSTTTCAGRRSQCLSTSLDITGFARRKQDDTDDDLDEVQSALDTAFDCVNGHKVKEENAPLLRAIFNKYGDITRESVGKPPTIVSFFLERICAIYERLKETKFSKVTRKDLNEMLDEVRFLESQKMNLSWLHEKLLYIHNTKMSFQNYLTVKEDVKRSDTIITNLADELEVHKREISLIEEKLVAEKAKADQIKKKARDIRVRVDDL